MADLPDTGLRLRIEIFRGARKCCAIIIIIMIIIIIIIITVH